MLSLYATSHYSLTSQRRTKSFFGGLRKVKVPATPMSRFSCDSSEPPKILPEPDSITKKQAYTLFQVLNFQVFFLFKVRTILKKSGQNPRALFVQWENMFFKYFHFLPFGPLGAPRARFGPLGADPRDKMQGRIFHVSPIFYLVSWGTKKYLFLNTFWSFQ